MSLVGQSRQGSARAGNLYGRRIALLTEKRNGCAFIWLNAYFLLKNMSNVPVSVQRATPLLTLCLRIKYATDAFLQAIFRVLYRARNFLSAFAGIEILSEKSYSLWAIEIAVTGLTLY